MFDILTVFESLVEIIKVVPKTLLLALIILLLSFVLGAAITYIQSLNIPVIKQVIDVLQSFLRGTPNVVLLYLVYYSLPLVVSYFLSLFDVAFDPASLNSAAVVIVTFSICYSVFQSEIIRGALHSLDKDQIEAAQSLGYSTTQTLRKVIVPQVMTEALPDTMNAFLIIIKALSLAFLVTVVDIFAQARLVGAQTFSYLEAFVAAALVYWVICGLLTYLINKLENRMRRGYA
ncbi:MAG TPA: amino acid ABC transporter permease [Candidatus Salinicoccus stercoripullorum]|uniref:Amino acid ABC transporter permease n=1 Tax=Candidatus Salinicoccus stercoripullorum TaxID=2838756 RepID=A0A9D1QGY0_9STAP|nr:amino acid ABC transporter permease [Candidatus Salinicoccus stercoripullorum]